MKLPTQQQCLNYFKEYKVPENIKRHCLKVQEAAVFLARELCKSGVEINVELVRAGSILHDLFKMAGIKDLKSSRHHPVVFSEDELAMREELRKQFPGKHETQIAHEIFKDEFPELALTLLHEGDPYLLEKTIEEALITYVDYRIFKERIVSLDERFAYFAEVYAAKNNLWEIALEHNRKIEQELFKKMSFTPEELGRVIEHART